VNTSLKEFQRYCLAHNVTFVSYMMPGAKEPVTQFVNSQSQITFKNIADIPNSSGFLFSPFQDENLPTIVIPNENIHTGWTFEIDSYPSPLDNAEPLRNIFFTNIVNFDEYTFQINYLKDNYLKDNTKKIVLSRTKMFNAFDYKLLPEIFEQLVHEYKHAFTYLLYTPNSGIWLGATPETLLNISNNGFSTMALAGTTEYSANKYVWTEKEIREQQHVVTFVRKKLSEGGYSFHESGRDSSRAGNVMHLQTLFSGKLLKLENEWKNLVALLYPTPAICGTDDDESLSIIRKMEKHNREYYSGIIGPYNQFGNTNLFINLRSMKVVGCNALLYAGGGILKTSNIQKEWEETELKFNTLLKVLEKVMGKL
jgi:isochorismate synthase